MNPSAAIRAAARPVIMLVMPLLVASTAFAVAAPRIAGIAAAIVNDVRVAAAGAAQPRPAAVRQRIAIGDRVQTGPHSRLQILLLDRSVFTVGANARLTIDRFVYDPDNASISATVSKGAFRFISGGRGHRGGSAIDTPVASIGIRGTIVDAVIGAEAIAIARRERALGGSVGGDPETATLVVLRGPGSRSQGNVTPGAISVTANQSTIELDRPLLAAYVPGPGAAPMGPFTISLPGLARLNDLISPRPQPAAPSGESPAVPPSDADRPLPRWRDRLIPPQYPPDDGQGGPAPVHIPALPEMPDKQDPGEPKGMPDKQDPDPPKEMP